jgi:DNA-binding MarR family transcriptional regulator
MGYARILEVHMPEPSLVVSIEQIMMAGVAVTTVALAQAQPGVEFNFAQWRVLVVLGNEDSGLTMTQVAARIGVTLPATTRQLRRLAARHMVVLEPDPADRRAVRVRLSEYGRAARESILAYRRAEIARAVADLAVPSSVQHEVAQVAQHVFQSLTSHPREPRSNKSHRAAVRPLRAVRQ